MVFGIAVDRAVPFGRQCWWLAVTSPDAATAADVLGLIRRKRVTWGHGVELAYGGAVFVTPPIGPWVLVPGRGLPDAASPGFLEWVVGLSARLGHVQFFETHRFTGTSAWVLAVGGRLRRAYHFDGAGVPLFEGEVTVDEVALGVGTRPESDDDETWWDTVPGEGDVLALARRWSVDPTTIEGVATDGDGITGRLRR
ncbi:hypothetical protein FHX81_1185 [Saccharothrix saharensis]|uniref:Uncharacterized protein n=1 Tax=Saccharothrix saharensis TaxID=571190 RepID=A0A543J7U8_9PSEU|nr:hypothetical protein [Saccharothrix saharensis]TQM78899.1 hypothetical protein FHX81_1185 [Saccharothrix saharensis]